MPMVFSMRAILTEGRGSGPDKVDYGGVYEWKNTILPKAYRHFQQTTSVDLRGRFETFANENAWWLEDYAAYKAIKTSQEQKPWYEWPDPLKLRIAPAVKAEADRLYDEIQAEKFYQFLFYSQWNELRLYANKHGIKIIGDIPIFIALDSSDVWCNQEKFKLNDDGSPSVVAGVPPDYFSKTGQLWGNPIYNWDAMRQDGFSWWIARVAAASERSMLSGSITFAALPLRGSSRRRRNRRARTLGNRSRTRAFRCVEALGDLAIIAEDLGVITPDVEELRDGFGFPGMRILQFAFGGDANHDLPHNYVQNCVAYTGTHDNDTTVGWWNSQVVFSILDGA